VVCVWFASWNWGLRAKMFRSVLGEIFQGEQRVKLCPRGGGILGWVQTGPSLTDRTGAMSGNASGVAVTLVPACLSWGYLSATGRLSPQSKGTEPGAGGLGRFPTPAWVAGEECKNLGGPPGYPVRLRRSMKHTYSKIIEVNMGTSHGPINCKRTDLTPMGRSKLRFEK
jgi:hypothetical protein